MEIMIHGRNMDVPNDLRDDVERRIDRLQRYMSNLDEVRVDLVQVNARNVGERNVAQLTIRNTRGVVLRAEEHSSDILAALDAAMDKMYRQIQRYRGKGKWRRRNKGQPFEELEIDVAEDEEYELEDYGPIVRRKRFAVLPMNEGEAIEHLELLGHDFFLYYNADTATVNLVYRRKDGGYGILEPELS